MEESQFLLLSKGSEFSREETSWKEERSTEDDHSYERVKDDRGSTGGRRRQTSDSDGGAGVKE